MFKISKGLFGNVRSVGLVGIFFVKNKHFFQAKESWRKDNHNDLFNLTKNGILL